MIARNKVFCFAVLLLLGFCMTAKADEAATIPADSKVYIAPMEGFEAYLKAAMEKKKVPLTVVDNKQEAAYEITGVAAGEKASTAKKIIMGSWHSKEEASIRVTDLKSGVVVFAYSYHTQNSAHGKQTSAESCAKHLKNAIKSH